MALARVAVLLALLMSSGRWQYRVAAAASQLDVRGASVAWLVMAAIGLAFFAVLIFGRRAPQPPAVLAVELLVAGALGFVPHVVWFRALGFQWFTQAVGAATADQFVQGLALGWFVVAAASLITSVRGRAARLDSPNGESVTGSGGGTSASVDG